MAEDAGQAGQVKSSYYSPIFIETEPANTTTPRSSWAAAGLTRTTQQANHAQTPGEWGMRVGAAYTQTGVLAKGRANGSAGEIEELGRELGLAGACPPPKVGTRRGMGTATQVP